MGMFAVERDTVLEKAIEVLDKHTDQHGEHEDCFACIASLWTTYLKEKLRNDELCLITEVNVAVMMALLKIARIKYRNDFDSYVDAVGYLSLAASRCPINAVDPQDAKKDD